MKSQFLSRLKLNSVFCQVVECGSMRKAAETLGISAAAVSQFITQLENDLGITLLYRSTRKITLSEAGEKYFEKAYPMLTAAKEADDLVSEIKQTLSGEIRIALPVGLAGWPIADALAPIMLAHKELKIHIIAKDTPINSIAERIDITLNVGKANDSGLIYHRLGSFKKNVFASPEYLKRIGKSLNWQDLQQQTWLGLSSNGILREITFCENDTQTLTFKPYYSMQFNDLNSLISHVRRGIGLALLPCLEIQHLIDSGELIALCKNSHFSDYDLYALTIDKKPSYKIQVILKAIKDYFNGFKG